MGNSGNSKSKPSKSDSSGFSTAGVLGTAIGAGAIAAAAYAAYSASNSRRQAPTSSTQSNFNPSYTVPNPIFTLPKPIIQHAKKASRLVCYSANEYVIPSNPSVGNGEFIPKISVPFQSKVDKYSMRVCPQYNSVKGCNFDPCFRFHVCQFWVRGNCRKDNCSYLHSFNGYHNAALLGPHQRKNFGEEQLLEVLKKGSFVGKSRTELIGENICIEHIYKKCNVNSCKFYHLTSQFVWEKYVGESWVKFSQNHNIELEKAFCDPNNNTIVLSVLPPSNSIGKPSLLCQALGDNSCIIDFEKSSLTSSNSYFRIRRLSTPSDILYSQSVATRFLWHWLDSNSQWQSYDSGTINNFFIIPLSDHLEFLYLKNSKEVNVIINPTKYLLSFENMTQVNVDTGQVQLVRRRPMFISVKEKWNPNSTFRNIWTKTSDDSIKFERMIVSSNSPEFSFIEQMLKMTLPYVITSLIVERIENPFLWESYQLKKKQYIDKYDEDVDEVNEQYLFHGTDFSVVDKICTDSFDWRLSGSRVGRIYGHGTYFSNLAGYSNDYAGVDNNGYKCMFIAFVLVGAATLGDGSMTIPPKNISTKKRFDTTVDNYDVPSIFVKYDIDDYYPAYFLKYRYMGQ